MAHAKLLWTLVFAFPILVFIAGPSLINGFKIDPPADAETLNIIRNGGFVASCAPPLAQALLADNGKQSAIHCAHDGGEPVIAVSFPRAADAALSADEMNVAINAPLAYGIRFQGRTILVTIEAKCLDATCKVGAAIDTGYTDDRNWRDIQFS